MTRFLKLSNIIINTSHIISIEKSPYSFMSYTISINKNINPSGFFMFGFGYMSSNNCQRDVLINSKEEDFKIITEFIENVNDVNNKN